MTSQEESNSLNRKDTTKTKSQLKPTVVKEEHQATTDGFRSGISLLKDWGSLIKKTIVSQLRPLKEHTKAEQPQSTTKSIPIMTVQKDRQQIFQDIQQIVKKDNLFIEYRYNPKSNKEDTSNMNKEETPNMNKEETPDMKKKEIPDMLSQYNIDSTLPSAPLTISTSYQDYTIQFPYTPYPCQHSYMQAVLESLESKSNALLQSPTGTGKTICLLSAALCWAEHKYKTTTIKHSVIYLSRTHSQLTQVEKELRKTCLRPTMGIMASRDQLCLKAQFSEIKGGDKAEACSKAVAYTRRLKKKDETMNTKKDKKLGCMYYRDKEYNTKVKEYLKHKLLSIDSMRQYGQEHSFCPYYAPYQHKESISLFLMPYNYILDSSLIESYKEMLMGSILIFDEAHNVPDSACDGRSVQLTFSYIEQCAYDLNRALEHGEQQVLSIHAQIKYLLAKINQYRLLINNYFKQCTFPYAENKDQPTIIMMPKTLFYQTIYELFQAPLPDQEKKALSPATKRKFQHKITQLIHYSSVVLTTMKESPACNSKAVSQVLAFILTIERLIKGNNEEEVNQFRILLKKHPSKSHRLKSFQETSEIQDINFEVELRCLVPWFTFNEIKTYAPHSIILTSGTLAPLDSLESQLRIKFNVKFINDHVILPEQLVMMTVKESDTGIELNFGYSNRQDNQQSLLQGFIDTLMGIRRAVPSGILVVCPSFALMNQCRKALKTHPQALTLLKNVIFEEKSNQNYLKLFKSKADSGAILFCVSRGKASEGINLPDDLCRAVVLLGVPYPNIRDPILMEKKKEMGKAGGEWYFANTIRAVNQALGRVMRHKYDYGALFLLDARYDAPQFRNSLPKWTRHSSRVVERFGKREEEEIKAFYKNMKQKYGSKHLDKEEQTPQHNTWSDIFSTTHNNTNILDF